MAQTLGQRRITAAGLPDDAQVVSASYDETHRCFVLTLESETFEALPHGAMLPFIDVTLTDHGPYEEAPE